MFLNCYPNPKMFYATMKNTREEKGAISKSLCSMILTTASYSHHSKAMEERVVSPERKSQADLRG